MTELQLLWLALWVSGFVLMTALWWFHHHDVTLADVCTFALGTMFMGPALVGLYLFSRWREAAPKREPIVLIYGRERKLR